MKSISLTEEQKKLFKRVEILAKSYRSKDNEIVITFDVYQGGQIESSWSDGTIQIYSPSGFHYETYEPYYDFIKELIFDNTDYFYDDVFGDNEGSWGSINAIYNFSDKILRFYANIYYYVTQSSSTDGKFLVDISKKLISLKNEATNLPGDVITMYFDGGGDSGEIYNMENEAGDQVDVPDGIQDYAYQVLSNNFGGWENDEGGSGNIIFYFHNEENVTYSINMDQNVTAEDGHRYDLKISTK